MKNNKFKEIEAFKTICKMSQMTLKRWLEEKLVGFGYAVITGDGYVYARGTLPVLVTAHMDTVHKELVDNVTVSIEQHRTRIYSKQGIGGDDRCGIYMILKLLERGLRPYVLFCEDEEIGGVGSAKFVKSEHIKELNNLHYLVELDRANSNDAVYYDCGNKEFMNWVEKVTGYEEDYGSFSDISHLSPACDVASVNLSCGYYNAHTLNEYVIFEEMLHTIDVVESMLKTESKQFKYEKKVRTFGYGYGYNYGYSYSGYFGNRYGYDDYEDYYDSYTHPCVQSKANQKSLFNDLDTDNVIAFVTYITVDGKEEYVESRGNSKKDALLNFFIDHPMTCAEDVLDYEFDYEMA